MYILDVYTITGKSFWPLKTSQRPKKAESDLKNDLTNHQKGTYETVV